MSSDEPSSCPVDHKSREAWLSQARAAASSSALPSDHPPFPSPSSAHPSSTTTTTTATEAEKCPVDHKAREVWLQQARAATEAAAAAAAATTTNTDSSSPSSSNRTSSTSWAAYLPSLPSFWSSSPSSSNSAKGTPKTDDPLAARLATEREVSTIPRTATSSYPGSYSAAASEPLPSTSTSTIAPSPSPPQPPAVTAPSHGAPVANNEQETGADATSGNWIYPSERMFFEAMRRKGHDPRATDMRAVVPIHNAVNERAWAEIKAWEAPWVERARSQLQQQQQKREEGAGGGFCDGPRLHSFSGLGGDRLSPRARFNTLLGYQAPFDRHDWVVDRCGTRVEYVIDFYAGRGFGSTSAPSSSSGGSGPAGTGGAKPLSFYLDVRPKLNTWEGVKMRAFKAVGLA
ncbi:Cytochrome c1 heme lyase [Diatrype stigma]|uniref:Holocytochrome c-type synthase n=1 Tax=Diatrype stigma TaxID=117547 RepID=A0AAN9UIU1_9PEZI